MHDTSIWMSLTSFSPISLAQPLPFPGWRGTGRTYWRMVQMSKHGDSWAGNGLSCTHVKTHTHRSPRHIQYRERGRGEERELNTLSGSLVERATGLAPHWLICESLLLKQLCASVHTLCWHGGSSALTHLHINKPPETFIKCWENRQYLHVKLPRTSMCLARATLRASAVLQILGCTRGMIMTSSVQLLQLPIAPVMMERNTLLTLLALSTQPAYLKSGLY